MLPLSSPLQSLDLDLSSISFIIAYRVSIILIKSNLFHKMITQVLRQDVRGIKQGRGESSSSSSISSSSSSSSSSGVGGGNNNSTTMYMCNLDGMRVEFETLGQEIIVKNVGSIQIQID